MDCSELHFQRHKTPLERFREKFIPIAKTGCWLWISGSRYGTFFLNGEHIGAHKAAWILYNQEQVPAGVYVLHKCDISMCVNPDHLFLGTPQDNMDDMDRKGRRVNVRGVDHKNSKLTEKQVFEIRIARLLGKTYKEIAARHNITRHNASKVARNETWCHITFGDDP